MVPPTIDVLRGHVNAVREGKATPEQLRELRENLREFKTPEDKDRLASAFQMRFEADKEKFIMDTVEKNLTDLELRQLRLATPQTPEAKAALGAVEPVSKFIRGEVKEAYETSLRVGGGVETTGGTVGRWVAIGASALGIGWLAWKIVNTVSPQREPVLREDGTAVLDRNGRPVMRDRTWLGKALRWTGIAALGFFVFNRLGGTVEAAAGYGQQTGEWVGGKFGEKPAAKPASTEAPKPPDQKSPSPAPGKPAPGAKAEGGGEKK